MQKTLFRKKNVFPRKGRLLSTASLCFAMLGASAASGPGSSSTKICSASDLHYFAPSLLQSDGAAFQTYLAQDRKLIAESKAITAALVERINAEKPALFLVTGDLTKDGELASHQELAQYLKAIEMNGVTKVFVIPGNHDVNNVDAVSYNGATSSAVDYISPSNFKSIYQEFGYGEAAAADPHSLSYLAKPSPKLWVLGVDVCMYDSNMVRQEPVTAGRFKPETYAWVLAQLADAKKSGATVVGMMHHGLVEHYAGQNVSYPEYLVNGWDTISTKFADAGLKMMFTGHYHANDIAKRAGAGANFVFDIETGSTVTWPCPYRVMTLNANNQLDITTKHIEAIDYDTDGKDFQAYAKEYLDKGMHGIALYALTHQPYMLSDQMAAVLAPHIVEAYAAHYAGDEKMLATEKGFIDYLAANNNALFAGMLTGLWSDLNPSDNFVALNLATGKAQTKQTIQLVYTSDAHYGITRSFRGQDKVSAKEVNAAMIEKINSLSYLDFPIDNGVNEGINVGGFEYLIETGDIANRSESSKSYQSAADSWAQFKSDYIDGLTLTNSKGQKTGLLLAPGNHDVSNAIGYYKSLIPAKDSTSMANIYSMMMPSPRPAGPYVYANEKIHYSRNIGGVHFMFVNIWPDASERAWMAEDLKTVSITTPVVIFTHDEPAVESKHFTNPNGAGDINAKDKFENLLLEVFKDGKTVDDPSTIEQDGFTQFVRSHRNIVAYFHGNTNSNEYYTYPGTDSTIALNTFRIDSPMKGDVSSIDEKKLSFQTLSIDTVTQLMTVRECLWNAVPTNPATPVLFGESKTVNLGVGKNLVAFTKILHADKYTDATWAAVVAATEAASAVGDEASIVALDAAVNGLILKPVLVASIVLHTHAMDAFPARTFALGATVLPRNADNKILTWKSLDETVATVNNGIATALKVGTTKIVALSADAKIADTCTFSVIAPVAGYVRGDFHQHTTYTDGSYTFAHMMAKNNQFGLDWWANSEHGGAFARDGKVSGEDVGNMVYFDSYKPNPIIGTVKMSSGHQNMWRWQSLEDYEYTEMLDARLQYPDRTLIQSYEWNVPGHEHGSMGLIAGQFGDNSNCTALSQFEFMFDNSDTDLTGGTAQGWTKSTKSGHEKTLEALTWLQANYGAQSYVVPAHPERQKKYQINHFRDMNTAAPDVCFGFESMPGHQKDAERGGYSKNADGGGTYGGCGIYAAQVGGLWDAMLSEGRHFWLFANSDCHFADGDFYPGEYQKNYTYSADNASAQAIVDGLRSGNTWVVEGDLIDSLIYNITPATNKNLVASMGQELELTEKGIDITIKMRDPQSANYNTYSDYTKPSVHHLDVIMGKIGTPIPSADARYSVPTVATTSVIARFDANGQSVDANGLKSSAWTSTGKGWKEMTLHLDNVTDSVYFRLRATNMSLDVTNETDGAGNPLSDTLLGENSADKAFADLWMYSNPIFVNQSGVFVDSVAINKQSMTLAVGKTADLTADVYPAAASDKSIQWTSSDEAIATVAGGVVTAVSAGQVQVTVTSVEGAKTAVCSLTVVVPVDSVTFTHKSETLGLGKSVSLAARVYPENATNQSVEWISSAPAIVRVINGEAIALASGSAVITVTTADGHKTATCTVNVMVSPAVVLLDASAVALTVGAEHTLTASIYPAIASNKAVEWTSSAPEIATVENGVIKAIATGKASIIVTTKDGLQTDTCIIDVTAPTTSYHSAGAASELILYPVPAHGELNIVIPQELAASAMMLVNSSGQNVLTLPVDGLTAIKLDVARFAKGIYFVQFQTANGAVNKTIELE